MEILDLLGPVAEQVNKALRNIKFNFLPVRGPQGLPWALRRLRKSPMETKREPNGTRKGGFDCMFAKPWWQGC